MRKIIIAICVLVIIPHFASATAEPNAQFVNGSTVFYARVTPERIDVTAVEKFIVDSVGDSATTKPADFSQFTSKLHEQFGEMERWLREFKEAGGHEIDLAAQSQTMEQHGPMIFVPLDDKANGEQIANLFDFGHKDGPAKAAGAPPTRQTEIIPHKAVLFGDTAMREQAKKLIAAPAPTIAAAMTASEDAPELFIIAPDSVFRAHMLQNLPQRIGTITTADIVNGTTWAMQFAFVPPSQSEHLVVQCKDATSSQKFSMLMGMGLMALQMAPDKHVQARTDLVQLLAPHVAGDRVEINLDQDQVARLVRALEPYYMYGVHQQQRVTSMNNMKQILLAMTMYENDHKGEWPKTMNDLKTFLPGGDVFTNPAEPDRHPAYIYVKPKPPIADPGQEMVLYEAHAQFGDGINVGFADGHIEFISNSQRFKDLLLQSMQENSPDQ